MADLEGLRELVERAAEGLPQVVRRRIFGCDALFADGQIFALVWKEGRIGVKLTDGKFYGELAALPGAGPWKAGETPMAQWLLVPPAMHTDRRALRRWVERAHHGAVAAPSKAARPRTGKTTKTRR